MRMSTALLSLSLALALSARARAADAPAPSPLADVARSYESARLLTGADRLAALDEVDRSLAQVMAGKLEGEARTQARFLSGAIDAERGHAKSAYESFHASADAMSKTPWADDAAFAAIQALEAQGRDEDAAAQWLEWQKRYATSPLLAESRLAQAWNFLRRGKTPEAKKALTAMTAGAPWMGTDARTALARATCDYLDGKTDEALADLATATPGASTTYLRALCYQAKGMRLKAAAAFLEVSDRYPDSPLRDHALLAKANSFLAAGDYRSAAEEFARVRDKAQLDDVKAEAELRAAACVFLSGSSDSALAKLRACVEDHAGTDVAARAQFLIGEVLFGQKKYADAIVEYNRVLETYFQHAVASSAQYRVARCLDALDRRAEATGSYQAVVKGYPLQPEAPAAAYLAGVGLLDQDKPLVAAPYFQIVLDRYAARADSAGFVVFASPQHQELVEAALCLLEYSYHQAGNLGQMSGAPHLLLAKLPPSRSPWRAYAVLLDADAQAAQGRYAEAQKALEHLTRDYSDAKLAASANRLLAWTYAEQGQDSLAIATEEKLVAKDGASDEVMSAAMLDIANVRFNQKRFADAAQGYEDFLRRFPAHPKRPIALYQAGLCYVRLERAGDAVDRWETMTRENPKAALSERAWARAGDLYFQAERYEDAKRCYQGLLANFSNSTAAAVAQLRMAQCDYNAGRDAAALAGFSETQTRFPGTPIAREAARGSELALYRLGSTPSGTATLAKLVEQYPNSSFAADAQFQIGWRAYQDKKYAEAAENFRRVVSQFPGYSAADRAHFLMADSYAQSGDNDKASAAYEQFLSFFPQSELRSTVQFRLGLMQFQAKDYMRAAVAFTSVLGDSATRDVASASRYNLALCQRLLGQTDEARSELEQYRTQFGDDERAADVAYQLGDIDENAERTADAAKEFERALAAKPALALATELRYRLGRCKEKLNDPDGALRSYQEAATLGERGDAFRLSAVARAAVLYETKRDVPHAIAAYRDLIKNGKDPELIAAATDRVAQLEGGAGHRR
jgi:TolA-binding protein